MRNKMPHNSCKLTVFYDMDSWHKLLAEEDIYSYLGKLESKNRAPIIEFGSQQGANITFSFIGDDQLELAFFKGLIGQFLDNNPVISKKKFDNEDFFMDFPTNTIFYGSRLEDTNSIKIFNEASLIKIKQLISKLILKKLKDDTISEDNLLLFLFELQLRLTEVLYHSACEAQEHINILIKQLSTRMGTKAQVAIDKSVNNIFYSNFDDFKDQMKFSWKRNKPKDEDWLYDWEKGCSSIMFLNKEEKNLFIKISSLVFEQLNVRDNYKLLYSCKLLYNVLLLA